MQPLIDPEFSTLLSPLSAEQLTDLEASLVTDGCRDALVLWGSTLIDGHNRLAICERLGIPYRVIRLDFPERVDARVWMRRNQGQRRNWTDDQRAADAWALQQDLSVVAKRERAAKGGETGGRNHPKAVSLSAPSDDKLNPADDTDWSDADEERIDAVVALSNALGIGGDKFMDLCDEHERLGEVLIEQYDDQVAAGWTPKADAAEAAERVRAHLERDDDEAPAPVPAPAPPVPKRDTRAEAAATMGVSQKKVQKFATVAKASPTLAAAVAAGTTTLADAVRSVKRAEIVQKLEATEAREAKALAGVYDVLVIDPPWPMEKIDRDERPNQAAFDYPTMTEAQLADMPIPAAGDCHVWLWTTHRFLPMALRLLDVWGIKYVCTFVWHKPGGFQPIGLPQYNCEFAIYARKGSPKFIDTKAFSTCFDAPRGAHSEKPGAFYDMVRRVTAGRRADLFNRRAIEGFDGWGKEAA